MSSAPQPVEPSAARSEATAQPASVLAVLGFVAAGELTAFSWLAEDAAQAPDVATRVALSRLAAQQMESYTAVAQLLRAQDPALTETAAPYLGLLTDIGARVRPGDWWERLMRSYVAGGMIRDFTEVLCGGLAEPARGRVLVALGAREHPELVVATLTPVTGEDLALAARLALWGRRVAGEALGVVQPVLGTMTTHGGASAALGDLATPALSAISQGHARRMDRLGLTA